MVYHLLLHISKGVAQNHAPYGQQQEGGQDQKYQGEQDQYRCPGSPPAFFLPPSGPQLSGQLIQGFGYGRAGFLGPEQGAAETAHFPAGVVRCGSQCFRGAFPQPDTFQNGLYFVSRREVAAGGGGGLAGMEETLP